MNEQRDSAPNDIYNDEALVRVHSKTKLDKMQKAAPVIWNLLCKKILNIHESTHKKSNNSSDVNSAIFEGDLLHITGESYPSERDCSIPSRSIGKLAVLLYKSKLSRNCSLGLVKVSSTVITKK